MGGVEKEGETSAKEANRAARSTTTAAQGAILAISSLQ